MEEYLFIIPFLLFPLFFFFIIKIGLHFEKKKRTQVGNFYQELSNKFGLNYIPESKGFLWNYIYPQVQGEIAGGNIILYSYKSGGKNKTVYTDLSITNPKNTIDFRIVKENFFTKIGKAFGAQDIQIGHPELDKLYIFKCKDEELMRSILDEEITAMLLHLNKDISFSIDNKNTKFRYNFIGHVDTKEKKETLEKILVLMVKILEKLP